MSFNIIRRVHRCTLCIEFFRTYTEDTWESYVFFPTCVFEITPLEINSRCSGYATQPDLRAHICNQSYTPMSDLTTGRMSTISALLLFLLKMHMEGDFMHMSCSDQQRLPLCVSSRDSWDLQGWLNAPEWLRMRPSLQVHFIERFTVYPSKCRYLCFVFSRLSFRIIKTTCSISKVLNTNSRTCAQEERQSLVVYNDWIYATMISLCALPKRKRFPLPLGKRYEFEY